MPFDESKPTYEEIEKFFLANPQVPERTFEIALVLGGTVSAGAYTAGVLDFLIQALDAWTEARRTDPQVPQHNVVLRVVTGTSGGGVNAAILARALNCELKHISSPPESDGVDTGNPFYDTWVNQLTLDRFLDTSDLDGGILLSVLNGACIDEGAEKIISFGGPPKQRAWIAAPLRLFLTLTNLRGIPFRVDFGNRLGEAYVDHADWIRFAICYPHQDVKDFRPDELVLGFDKKYQRDWSEFSRFARATGAFPIGFPPRELTRPTAHYRYRVVRRPPEVDKSPDKQPEYDLVWPNWAALRGDDGRVPETYQFVAVDGGATDNEPIALAHTALCGLLESNPRDPRKANRAVILVDPFAGEAELGPREIEEFARMLGGLSSTLIQQTRYDSRDLELAADESVFSRFMITPRRELMPSGEELTGAKAIAASGLGAFIGFACPEFMRHDYLLGRRNCQQFLRRIFVLAAENQVFGGQWNDTQRERFAKDAPAGKQPIIPLVGAAAAEQKPDVWPKGCLDPEVYRRRIEKRFEALAKLATSGSPLRSIIGAFGGLAFKGPVSNFVVSTMQQSLKEAELDGGADAAPAGSEVDV